MVASAYIPKASVPRHQLEKKLSWLQRIFKKNNAFSIVSEGGRGWGKGEECLNSPPSLIIGVDGPAPNI